MARHSKIAIVLCLYAKIADSLVSGNLEKNKLALPPLRVDVFCLRQDSNVV